MILNLIYLTGKTFDLEVDNKIDIQSLKNMIKEEEKFDIIFRGRKLDNEKTLSFYNIKKDNTKLYIQLRLSN